MGKVRNELIILLGVIVGLALFGFALFFAISALLRAPGQEAAPTMEAENRNLQTRVAELVNQTPTVLPNPDTVIHEIRSLARLETIQYSMEKVITVEQGQGDLGFLFGDRLLFVGHGKVIAGIDMARLRPEDMRVEGQTLYFRAPPAEVFVATLDNDKSYVYNRDTGLLTKGNVDLERTARVAAEQEILQAALEDGILIQAQQNAESFLSRMLRGLGYEEVIFVYDATPQPQPGANDSSSQPTPVEPTLLPSLPPSQP